MQQAVKRNEQTKCVDRRCERNNGKGSGSGSESQRGQRQKVTLMAMVRINEWGKEKKEEKRWQSAQFYVAHQTFDINS